MNKKYDLIICPIKIDEEFYERYIQIDINSDYIWIDNLPTDNKGNKIIIYNDLIYKVIINEKENNCILEFLDDLISLHTMKNF